MFSEAIIAEKVGHLRSIYKKLGLYYSSDSGDSCTEMQNGLTNLDVRTLAVDPNDPRIIYAGTMGGGVFKYVKE